MMAVPILLFPATINATPLPVLWIDPHQAIHEEEMARAHAVLGDYTELRKLCNPA